MDHSFGTNNFISMKSAVEFLDVVDVYSKDRDVVAKFKCYSYTPKDGDRIALFKLGWTAVSDYHAFEWIPTGPFRNNSNTQFVVFLKDALPDSTALYQFCYISVENELQGASQSFTFTSGSTVSPLPPTLTPLSKITVETKVEDELKKLKEENLILRKAFKSLTLENNDNAGKNYDKEITELRDTVQELKAMLKMQQSELNMLRQKVMKDDEANGKLLKERNLLEMAKQLAHLEAKNLFFHKEESPLSFDIKDLKPIPPFPFPNK